MTIPAGPWLVLDEVDSTQRVAAETLHQGESIGVVFAHDQRRGTGRFGREWVSTRGESLTFTLIFDAYAGHKKPYLIGMACAVAVAEALDLDVRWPNDLSIDSRKVGGILTELLPNAYGDRVPVVGIGVNLNQERFPEAIAETATSLWIAKGKSYDAEETAHAIMDHIATFPEPFDWSDIEPRWKARDKTPGKRYVLSDGRSATALEVLEDAQLRCLVGGDIVHVMAAQAIFGEED